MKYFLLAATAALACAQPPAATPPPADPVVLTIGTEKITKSKFEEILASLPERQRAEITTPEARKKIAEQVAELITLAQEARARKLDKTTRLEMQFHQVLASAVYQDYANAKPSDDEVKAYYDAHKNEWEEAKARHILIRFTGSRVPVRPEHPDLSDPDALKKATEVRAKIAGGADFAAIAKAESDDVGTGEKGGDLGDPFGRGRMVPEFDTAVFSLPVGELSQPVRSQFGYHLIQVQSRQTKPMADVRLEIEQKLKPQMAQRGLDALKKKTVVTFDDSYFAK